MSGARSKAASQGRVKTGQWFWVFIAASAAEFNPFFLFSSPELWELWETPDRSEAGEEFSKRSWERWENPWSPGGLGRLGWFFHGFQQRGSFHSSLHARAFRWPAFSRC